MRAIIRILEAVVVYGVYGSLWLLPLGIGTRLMAWLLSTLGPLLPVNRIAQKNLQLAFPDATDVEREKWLHEHWRNLGMTIAEIPHVAAMKGEKFRQHVQIKNLHFLEEAQALSPSVIIFSGHFANWEIIPRTGQELGLDLVLVYRHANNPYVEKLIRYSRRESHTGLYQKGRDASREIIRAIRDGRTIGILADQKNNAGLPVALFGKPAMTSSAIADLSIRNEVPLLPLQIIRTGIAQFEIILHPPIMPAGRSNLVILEEIHRHFEQWIREHPSQWFWLHRRWDKSFYIEE